MVFCFVQNFFFRQHMSQNINFFPVFNIRLYDKNSESDYFFSSTKIRIFFSATLGIRIFFQKKTITPPFKLNGRSLNNSTNIHKTNKHLLPSHCTQEKTTTCDVGNPGPVLGQAQKCGGGKPVNDIPMQPSSLANQISDDIQIVRFCTVFGNFWNFWFYLPPF